MRKIFKDEKTQRLIVGLTTSGICIILFYLIILNFNSIMSALGKFLYVCSPFIWGLLFALLTMPLAKKLEALIGDKMSFGKKRTLVSILCILLIIILIAIFCVILIPQLVSSFSDLTKLISDYADTGKAWLEELGKKFAVTATVIDVVYEYSTQIVQGIWSFVTGNIPGVVGYVSSVVTNLGNFFMGFVIGIYILIDREHLYSIFKRFFKAILPKNGYEYTAHVKDICVDRFGKFFIGKLIDSTIMGILCYVIMLILNIEYAVLISFVVAITNMIPFFGPIIGAIPGIIILLIINPIHAVMFGVEIFVLQQVDGNFIGPNILGNKIGISSLWIMVAIIIGGAYFGFFGMLLGVPTFSIIYTLIKEAINKRIEIKEKEEKMKLE